MIRITILVSLAFVNIMNLPSNSSYLQNAKKIIQAEEGYREAIYRCPAGYLTIFYGHNLEAHGLGPFSKREFVNSNPQKSQALIQKYIDDHGPQILGTRLLEEEIKRLDNVLSDNLDFYSDLSPNRKSILISTTYQLGWGGISDFKGMIRALREKNYWKAAWELTDSRLFDQAKRRTLRSAIVIASDVLFL